MAVTLKEAVAAAAKVHEYTHAKVASGKGAGRLNAKAYAVWYTLELQLTREEEEARNDPGSSA